MYGVQYIIIIMKIIILFYRHRYYIILLYTMRYDNNNIIYLNGGGQPPRAPQPTVFNDAGGGRRDGSARDAVMSWSSRLGRPTCHARQAIRHTAPDRTYAHVVAVAASVRFRIDNNISYRYSLVVGTSLFRFRSPSSPQVTAKINFEWLECVRTLQSNRRSPLYANRAHRQKSHLTGILQVTYRILLN